MAVDKAQLQAWIESSQRTQRRVVAIAIVGAVVAFVLRATSVLPSFVGVVLILGAVITGVCGFWVTAAHIADWRARLRDSH
jgi:uncharacterized membrane protein HdeD (DUF308 family)